MIIEVKLLSYLRKYLPNSGHHLGGHKWDISEGSTVRQVLEMFNIPEGRTKIVLINGRHADIERTLNEDDVLLVIPPMPGG